MEENALARIGDWDRRTVGDGRDGLSELGAEEFSGAVDTDAGWLLVLNGRIVGTHGMSLDQVGDDDTLTARVAPHPSLPLLFAMRERGGERRGRYFTDETGLEEVHETLSSGRFTGYVELSEQVLSGDYHVVYYGGRAMFVAFLGSSGRLVTGEEAFERARDEVGIYEVYAVDLEVREPPGPSGDAGGQSGRGRDGTDNPTGETRDPDPATDSGPATSRDREREPSGGNTSGADTADDPIEGLRDPDPDAARARIEAEKSAGVETTDPGEMDRGRERSETRGQGRTGVKQDREDRIAEIEAEIESLRDRIEALTRERDRLTEGRGRTSERKRETTEKDGRTAKEDDHQINRTDQTAEGRGHSTEGGTGLDFDLEGDFLTEQTATTETLDPSEALAEADVLLRYDSGDEATLAHAHGGDAGLGGLRANRRLETHARVDGSNVTVDGEPFDTFLRDTLRYKFVAWLVGECLFGIREAGAETALENLYDALPGVDRAEFDGTVRAGRQNSGEPGTAFDIVFRNRTGEPLVLADIDEGWGPTDKKPVSELLDRSRRVAERRRSVDSVFLVTSTFFEPEAQEAVRGATRRRNDEPDSRMSFVKTTRGGGYHVCLAETRNDGFHLSRPEI